MYEAAAGYRTSTIHSYNFCENFQELQSQFKFAQHTIVKCFVNTLTINPLSRINPASSEEIRREKVSGILWL